MHLDVVCSSGGSETLAWEGKVLWGPREVASREGTYRDALLAPVHLPVPAAVAEHQEVAGHPVGAPVPALRGHCGDRHPVPEVEL